MTEIRFDVPTIPIAQPRQRVTTIAGHATTYTLTRSPVNQFKATVQMACAQVYSGPPLDEPLFLDVIFVLPRPKSLTRKRQPNPRVRHAKKPDLDNLLKSLKDALTGLVWTDDSRVCAVHAVKAYASASEQPHVEVAISGMTDTVSAIDMRSTHDGRDNKDRVV